MIVIELLETIDINQLRDLDIGVFLNCVGIGFFEPCDRYKLISMYWDIEVKSYRFHNKYFLEINI